MKFAIAYSCGKDSTFALEEMINAGHTPVCMLAVMSPDARRSYRHAANYSVLQSYSDVLGIPLLLCMGNSEHDAPAVEAALRRAGEMGAEATCTGDIEQDGVRRWNEERAENVGLQPVFPLWHIDREEYMSELLRRGYKCVITSVKTAILPETLLGSILNEETLEMLRSQGVDICGESGEYHSMVLDCPIFKKPLKFDFGRIHRGTNVALFDPRVAEEA